MGFGQKMSVRILYAVCAMLGLSAVMLTNSSWFGGGFVLVVALIAFIIIYHIMKTPHLRMHSAIYNADEGVKPPVETFDDIGIPSDCRICDDNSPNADETKEQQ